MQVFSEYSHYYDLLYSDKDYVKEADYISDLISRFKIDAVSLLELGCGTGKHASILNSKGFKIHAIDLSKNMLDLAKEKFCADDLIFDEGDVRNYRINKKFDAVISLFHVASYQNSNQDLADFFNTANLHLKDGGIFIFDMWYGPAVLSQKPESRTKKLENKYLKIERNATPTIHYNENIVDVKYEILVTNKSDSSEKNIHEIHKMRYFFMPEIALFLEKSGFEIVNTEEWLTKKSIGCDSWGVCVVARKTMAHDL